MGLAEASGGKGVLEDEHRVRVKARRWKVRADMRRRDMILLYVSLEGGDRAIRMGRKGGEGAGRGGEEKAQYLMEGNGVRFHKLALH